MVILLVILKNWKNHYLEGVSGIYNSKSLTLLLRIPPQETLGST